MDDRLTLSARTSALPAVATFFRTVRDPATMAGIASREPRRLIDGRLLMVPGGALQAADLGVAARQKPRPGTEGRARTVMMGGCGQSRFRP
jgi:hypothetical protein